MFFGLVRKGYWGNLIRCRCFHLGFFTYFGILASKPNLPPSLLTALLPTQSTFSSLVFNYRDGTKYLWTWTHLLLVLGGRYEIIHGSLGKYRRLVTGSLPQPPPIPSRLLEKKPCQKLCQKQRIILIGISYFNRRLLFSLNTRLLVTMCPLVSVQAPVPV